MSENKPTQKSSVGEARAWPSGDTKGPRLRRPTILVESLARDEARLRRRPSVMDHVQVVQGSVHEVWVLARRVRGLEVREALIEPFLGPIGGERAQSLGCAFEIRLGRGDAGQTIRVAS